MYWEIRRDGELSRVMVSRFYAHAHAMPDLALILRHF